MTNINNGLGPKIFRGPSRQLMGDQDRVITPFALGLLRVALGLFVFMLANAAYLGSVTLMQWLSGQTLEDLTVQWVFLAHLVGGVLLMPLTLIFVSLHVIRAFRNANRSAVRLGLTLLSTCLALLASGILLTKGLALPAFLAAFQGDITYWIHVLGTVVVVTAFAFHRLAGNGFKARTAAYVVGISGGIGLLVPVFAGLFFAETGALMTPENAGVPVQTRFAPSLVTTSSGEYIDAVELMRDEYCAGCHREIHERWQASAHRFSSFNNPAYLFSVRNTRESIKERDGNVTAARLCAGCHDPVTLLSGAFDEADFDEASHPTADAGITCLTCHAIKEVTSNRGNAAFKIETPDHYPFAASSYRKLNWVSGVLLRTKPQLHKRSLMAPVHGSSEFCGSCHKVGLPEELNHYRWLRGQNHFDSFLLSGVAGHSAQSFYYPDEATADCQACHMPEIASNDPSAHQDGARLIGANITQIGFTRDHLFPGANTALVPLMGLSDRVREVHEDFLEESMRVDLFAIREVNGRVLAPLDDQSHPLEPGKDYVLDIVVRNLHVGHAFTQGTSDSNQVWLEVALKVGEQPVVRSGGRNIATGAVDSRAHFLNAYAIDREGGRIDRRNAEDIFAKLYDHQIPPGAADVVQYGFRLPEKAESADEFVEIEVSLNYRKFDLRFLRQFMDDPLARNDLPITTIASDRVKLLLTDRQRVANQNMPGLARLPLWERWNDYGIGLLLKPNGRALGRAASAFREVAKLGASDGRLNLARVYLMQGELGKAARAIEHARQLGAYPWVLGWLQAEVDFRNGALENAISGYEQILHTDFPDARARGFDFSKDYRVRVRLGFALLEQAKVEPNEGFIERANSNFQQVLDVDPENDAAHYGLAQGFALLVDTTSAERHLELYRKYREDDISTSGALQKARRENPVASHSADSLAIYELR